MRPTVWILAAALLAAPAAAQEQVADLSVRLVLAQSDSMQLAVEFFQSRAEEAPLALILPDRGARRQPLRVLAKLAQAEGYSVLLPDLRGQGESRFAPGGAAAPPDENPRRRMLQDMDSALEFGLRQSNSLDREGVIFAVGESWAHGLDLLAGRPELDRLYLVSPLEGGAPPRVPELPEGAKVFLVSCEGDEEARAAQMQLYLLLPEGARQQLLLPGRSRGAGMLRQQAELREQIRGWLAR